MFRSMALLYMALVSLVSMVWAQGPTTGPEAVVKAVIEAGGRVTREGGTETGRIVGVDLVGCQATDRVLGQLAGLPDLRDLDLRGSSVSDEELATLADLGQLKKLSLDNTPITDAGVPAIAKLRSIEDLDLRRTRITDQGVALLSALSQLRSLKLGGVPTEEWRGAEWITDRGLNALTHLQSLVSLSIARTSITDAGIDAVLQMKGLKALDIGFTRITPKGIRRLVDLEALEDLSLAGVLPPDKPPDLIGALLESLKILRSLDMSWNGTLWPAEAEAMKRVGRPRALSLAGCAMETPAMMARVCELMALEELDLTLLNMSDADVAGLARLSHLRKLNLGLNFRITDEGVAHLDGLAELEDLSLAGAGEVTDEGLKSLSGLTRLRRLDLYGTHVDSISALAPLSVLERLDLRSTRVGDDSIPLLVSLLKLRSVALGQTDVTGRGIEKLRSARPDLDVYAE